MVGAKLLADTMLAGPEGLIMLPHECGGKHPSGSYWPSPGVGA